MVGEDGREYYAISKDFNLKEAWNRFDLKLERPEDSKQRKFKEYWIRENVLRPIYYDLCLKDEEPLNSKNNPLNFSYKTLKNLINKYGKTNKQIAEDIKSIFSPDKVKHTGNFPNTYPKDVEFYGYFADYDWVVFCWLFGKMIDLPKGFPMYCIDLKQMLDEKPKIFPSNTIKCVDKYIMGIDPYFTKWEDHPNYPKQTNEHNALADARWNRELYKFLESL